MKKTISLSVLVFAVICGSIRTAAAQNREHLQMAAELRMLQEQAQQLALALAQLSDALKATNARIDETANANRKAIADQGLVVKGAADDLSAIRERTQDTDTRLRSLADEIEALRMTLLSLPSLLQQSTSTAPSLDPATPNATVGAAPPSVSLPPTAGLSPNRMYDTAWTDYTSGQYTLAITGFEQLIKTFPQSERADDAQFLIGEAQSALNRWPDAIAAYNQVIQNYPTRDQVPMAYYKRGIAQERAGQAEAARASYEYVMKTYPDTPAAVLAKQALDRLGRQAAPSRP